MEYLEVHVNCEPEFVQWATRQIILFDAIPKLFMQGDIGIWYSCPGADHIHEYLFYSNEWVTNKDE